MLTRPVPRRRSATALLLTVAFAACTEQAETPVGPELSLVAHEHVPQAFTVYTQNVYLGGDTRPGGRTPSSRAVQCIDFPNEGAARECLPMWAGFRGRSWYCSAPSWAIW